MEAIKMEAIKTISGVKGKGPVDYSTVTRWLKKFHKGCQNLDR